MPKQRRKHIPQLLKMATDQELSDGVLKQALNIPALKQCENRRDALLRAAESHGESWGDGKRCSPHHRCGNLACPICRRRAQLAFIILNSGLFRTSKARGGAK